MYHHSNDALIGWDNKGVSQVGCILLFNFFLRKVVDKIAKIVQDYLR